MREWDEQDAERAFLVAYRGQFHVDAGDGRADYVRRRLSVLFNNPTAALPWQEWSWPQGIPEQGMPVEKIVAHRPPRIIEWRMEGDFADSRMRMHGDGLGVSTVEVLAHGALHDTIRPVRKWASMPLDHDLTVVTPDEILRWSALDMDNERNYVLD